MYSLPEAAGFYQIFHPITTYFRKGNFSSFRTEMRRNGDWLKRKGLYLLLWRAGEELLWRALARRTFLIARELKPPPNPFSKGLAKTPPPQLSMPQLLCLANFLSRPPHLYPRRAQPDSTLFSESSHPEEGDEYTLDDIEGVILDLLDQGLIKGYIARQQKVVVLKREGNGFVSVEEARRWKAANAVEGGEGAEAWNGIVNGKVKVAGAGAAGTGHRTSAAGGGGGVVRLSGLDTIGS